MTAQTIPFPRARKRGAKVRNGPSAAILRFPKSLPERYLELLMLDHSPGMEGAMRSVVATWFERDSYQYLEERFHDRVASKQADLRRQLELLDRL